MEQLIPWLYLKGVSTGDFTDALCALVGKDAPGLSATTISRLKTVWEQDLKELAKARSVQSNTVFISGSMASTATCVWMTSSACWSSSEPQQDGKKELVAIDGGFRESDLSWTQLLTDLKSRGLAMGPELAIGDGALGYGKAIAKAYPHCRWQRCWVHKTANVMNKLPKSLQSAARSKL